MANRLTARFVESVRRPGKYGDGLGLAIYVKPTGSKSWIQRATIDGVRVARGLGPYPAVSLSQARDQAMRNWMAVREGRDPWAARTAARARAHETARKVPTVREACEAVMALNAPGLAPATVKSWKTTIDQYIVPALGRRPVDEIDAAAVVKLLGPIWATKPAMAKRVRARLSKVMGWSIALGHRTDDPTSRAIDSLLPRTNGNGTKHHEAVPYAEAGAVLAKLRETAKPAVAGCLSLIMHTGVRSSEARGARWEEFDLAAATWTIPAERRKTANPLRVALSAPVLGILAEARTYSLAFLPNVVFPSRRANRGHGGDLDDKSLGRALEAAGGRGAVVHGFRSTFSDWCAETGKESVLAETALGHAAAKTTTEAAYLRSDLLERRRPLMADWSEYLTR